MKIKNTKTGMVWVIDENHKDLINRINKEIDSDGNKIYEIAEDIKEKTPAKK